MSSNRFGFQINDYVTVTGRSKLIGLRFDILDFFQASAVTGETYAHLSRFSENDGWHFETIDCANLVLDYRSDREPGEFHIGDIVQVPGYCGECEVTSERFYMENSAYVAFVNHDPAGVMVGVMSAKDCTLIRAA